MTRAFMNGTICDLEEARVGVEDRGFLLGHGAFETLRVDDGVIRRWPRHLARLKAGLTFLGLNAPADLDAVRAAAATLARVEGLSNAVARLTVSAGEGGPGLETGSSAAPNLVVTLKARPAPPEAVSVSVLGVPRRGGLPSEAFKLSGYGGLIEARLQARANGFDRAVVTRAADGALACADCANVYWISGDRVKTPAVSAGALPGTARAALMEAAALQGLEIELVCEGADALRGADAAFMTNAVEGVTPISAVDGSMMDLDHPLLRRLRHLEQTAA